MNHRRLSAIASIIGLAAAVTTTGCTPRHALKRLPGPDGTLVATVDTIAATFGLTQDAVVSVQEKRGLASSVATFRNIERLDVSWLGPEDLSICETGQVIGYRTSVTLNTSTGKRTVHVHYGC